MCYCNKEKNVGYGQSDWSENSNQIITVYTNEFPKYAKPMNVSFSHLCSNLELLIGFSRFCRFLT